DYRLSNRGGKGIKTATITERNGNIVCITSVTGEEDLMVVTNSGVIIRIDVNDISQNGRAAQGVRLIKLDDNQFVSTVAIVNEEDEEEAIEESEANEASLTNAQTTDSESQDASSSNEAVVEDNTPGNGIHTEVEDDNSEEDGRKEVREDFMDRVNEDIDNADSDDNEEE
ncbi:DNA gyrase subunit A, partial [Staphylococcus cohnii]